MSNVTIMLGSRSVLLLFLSFVSLVLSFSLLRTGRLAIDYGPNTLGLAIADVFGNVDPLCSLKNGKNLSELSLNIVNYVREYNAKEVLVGLPVDSDGRIHRNVLNFNGRLCLNFSSVLCSVMNHELPGTKVLLVDESYSTREAKLRMRIENLKSTIDAVSAACILERYIEDGGENALNAEPCPYPPPQSMAMLDYGAVCAHVKKVNNRKW